MAASPSSLSTRPAPSAPSLLEMTHAATLASTGYVSAIASPATVLAGGGVQWSNAPGGRFDASSFSTLSFWIRGAAPNGFHIGLKDINEREVKVEARDFVMVSDTEWRQVVVPLARFADASGPVNLAAVRNANLGFNASHGSGSICIDDIAFQ